MNIAILEYEYKHTELLATFIELLYHIGLTEIDIYYHKQDFRNAYNYYKKIFIDIKVNEYNPSHLDNSYDNYDYIIMLSADETKALSKKSYYNQIFHKLIVIGHINWHFDLSLPYKRIVLSPLLKSANNKYILPIYIREEKEFRDLIPLRCKDNIFSIVGFKSSHYQQNSKNYKDLIKLLQYRDSQYSLIIFGAYVRELMSILEGYKNLNYKVDVGTNHMIDIIQESKFVLPIPTPGSWFYQDRMSGSIPIALNNNIPMILPEDMAQMYELTDCSLTYKESLIEVIDHAIDMGEEEYMKLYNNLLKYKSKIFNRNLEVFKNIISLPMEQICLKMVDINHNSVSDLSPYIKRYPSIEIHRIHGSTVENINTHNKVTNVIGYPLDKIDNYTLYETRKNTCTSIFLPNRNILNTYSNSDRFDIINNKNFISFPLQDVYDDLDILRIRVQACTDMVLLGAEKLLSKCILIDINYEFSPMYENQKTYEYIHQYLTSNNYKLVSLNNLVFFSKVDSYTVPYVNSVLAKSNFYTLKEPYTSYIKIRDSLLNSLSNLDKDIIDIIFDIKRVENKINALKYSENPVNKTGLCKYLPNNNLIFGQAIYINSNVPEDKEHKYNILNGF